MSDIATISLLGILLTVSPSDVRAQDAGDAVAGQRLAETWCGNCHVIVQTDEQADRNGVPTFAAIGRVKATTPLSLRVFLQTPHGGMPDLHVSQNDTDDLAAYILSLRRP